MAYQPKSYRKFVATAATATLVASAIAPAVGAASNFTDVAPKYKDAVDYLVVNNITQGTSDTLFGTHDNIKRGDLAIWLAKALKLDTTGAAASGFSDTKGTRYDAYVSVLKAKGYISGKSATEFAPNATVTRGEMAIMLSNAYDLKSDVATSFTDAVGNYKTAIQGLYAFGVTTGKSDTMFGTSMNITRGDLAIFLKRAAEVVKTPAVANVTVANGKELVVTFNQAVNKDKVAGKVSLTDTKTGSVAWNNPVLSEDGKTLTLTVAGDGVIDVKDATLTVEPIETKADAKKSTVRYVSLLTYSDNAAASVASVKAEDTTAVIKFSEPVKDQGTVSVNGTVTSNYDLSADGKTLTVKGLEAEKSYKVDLVGVRDFAGNLSNPISLSFTVSKPVVDNVKPTVATNVSGNKVTLNFSKAVTGTGEVKIGNETITITNPASLPTGVTFSEDKKSLSIDTQLYNNGAIFGNNSFVNVTIKVSNFTDGKNVMAEVTTTATLNADTKAPAFVSATAKADGTITVEFNEEVQVPNVNELTVTSIEGITQSPAKTFNVTAVKYLTVDGVTSKNKLVFTVDAPAASGDVAFEAEKTYGVELAKDTVKDVYGKTNADAVKFSVTRPKAGTSVDPSAVVKTDISVNANVITVVYSEDMTDSAKNAANYTLGGKALPSNATVEFINNRKNVKITLPAGYVTATGDYNFVIGDVVAKSGNTVDPTDVVSSNDGKSEALKLYETVAPTVNSKLTVNSSSQVVVSFSETVQSYDVDNDGVAYEGITTKVNGTTVGASYTVNGDGKLVVTLTKPVASASDVISVEFNKAELSDKSPLQNLVTNGTATN